MKRLKPQIYRSFTHVFFCIRPLLQVANKTKVLVFGKQGEKVEKKKKKRKEN